MWEHDRVGSLIQNSRVMIIETPFNDLTQNKIVKINKGLLYKT